MIIEDFDDNCIADPDSGCILWHGNRRGYALFVHNGRRIKAHRFALIRATGDPGDGLLACHHCDTPACVNPDHLFWGTHKDNMADGARKGRMGRPKKKRPGPLRKTVALPDAVWAAIGRWRAEQFIPSESEAIRRLVVDALVARDVKISLEDETA